MILTENFRLGEFLKTSHSSLYSLNLDYYKCNQKEYLLRLERLAVVLEIARSIIGKPLVITSGYRCPELNKAVGGVPQSAHVYCYAADVTFDGIDDPNEWRHFIDAFKYYNFDQLIYYPKRKFFHLSIDPLNRRQIIRDDDI